MKNLVLIAHDNFASSRINSSLINAIKTLDNVTIHHIPDSHSIDIKEEQSLLLNHDEIIFQFPLQWFSSPASLKSWFDKVLSYNWAYGEHFKLEGKKFRVVLTTGGISDAYQENGQNGITISEILKPIATTISYVKGIYLEPFIVHGVFQLNDEQVAQEAQKYTQLFK